MRDGEREREILIDHFDEIFNGILYSSICFGARRLNARTKNLPP